MRLWAPLFLLLAACGADRSEPAPVSTTLASAVNEEGLAAVVCDEVVAFSAPSNGTAGMLALGATRWTIAGDADLEGSDLLVDGAAVCAHLRFEEDGSIERLEIEPAPTDDPWADADE